MQDQSSPFTTKAAPVAFFAYARPEHTRLALESLARNALAPETQLFVYADAARSLHGRQAVAAVRDVIRDARGFASVTVIERETNYGLARNIIAGVTDVCERYGRVIVLEDDLVLSPHFLRYMNDALLAYAADARVASIHGYCYPTNDPLPETFFLLGADCWGWATWRRAWAQFNPDGGLLLNELRQRKLTHRFDFDGAYPYTRMLKNQVLGRNNSWAIRWHASCYLAEHLTLYPGRSLVHNIGNDSSGTHSGTTVRFDQVASSRPVDVERIPLVESSAGRAAFVKFFRTRREHAMRRLARRLQTLWKRPS